MAGRWGRTARRGRTPLPVNGNGHMLVLVSIDSDDHLGSVDDFATRRLLSFLPPARSSASAKRADKTAKGLEVILL